MATIKPLMSAAEKEQIWKRWKEGATASQIARELDRAGASVYCYLRDNGGIQPTKRTRAKMHLSLEEREEISIGVSSGQSVRAIAKNLGRSPSTISRELNRNGTRRYYRATKADLAAWTSAMRPKQCKLQAHARLRQRVIGKLKQDWSPEQISGWLKIEFPNDQSMQVSPETIYKSLFIQSRGLLKKELKAHLRTGRKFRHTRAGNRDRHRGKIVDGVSISERPAEVEDRALPGHWEGDLIAGTNNSYIATIVERSTRFVCLIKVDGKHTETVVTALIKQMKKLPKIVQQSLTWDRGMEMARHKNFTMATNIDVYFCDPQSPWQRGSNENTNGLLRQYLPKKSDLSTHSQTELNNIAHKLNTRPRKTLNYKSPLQALNEVLH